MPLHYISSLKREAAMDYQHVVLAVACLGLGWWTRSFHDQPPTAPCQCNCHCGCECIASFGLLGWVFGLLVVALICGITGWIIVHPPNPSTTSVSPVGTAKGTKGIYGSSHKLLTLTA